MSGVEDMTPSAAGVFRGPPMVSMRSAEWERHEDLVRQLRDEVARLNKDLAAERAAHWRCIRTIYALTTWGDR